VLPSHQENFGIAVVEALACGKPVLISDQVNIWREIVEDGAGIAEADTEEGVVKLLRKFLNARRDEGGSASAQSDSGVTRGGPRECYLKRFAIGPAVQRLADSIRD
jgi:glycosyltransferase involved in cell wall biosynthesis